jgi:hypothetical protein
MSTPDQPDTPPLTRKQLREIRNTGATPVIVPGAVPADIDAPSADEPQESPTETDAPIEAAEATESTTADASAPAHPVAPLPRAAEPVSVAPAPAADASVDLGASPLTRRQARQQERIRTASVPVITPDFAPAPVSAAQGLQAADVVPDADGATADDSASDDDLGIFRQPASVATDAEAESDIAADEEAERALLNPMFGAGVLAGQPAPVALPPSFDQLLARDTATTGSVATPHALIVSQAPSDAPLVAPVAATGEILVTGTFALPEGLGSTGQVPGTADGKEIDATLIDGELPAHSSPTPIAASAAISTVKTNDEIIRPPAPEKGGRLMLTLAITAGVLAVALVGVLVFALVTGVFS